MVCANLKGGLGNYMFQISAALSLSLENNDIFIIDESKSMTVHNNLLTYKSNIFRNFNFGISDYLKKYDEPFFHYKNILYEKNLIIDGYFQSEKYFSKHREELLKLFSVDDFNKDLLEKKYINIDFENSCSIHVRRGDYLNYINMHPTLSLEYYQKCVSETLCKNILIFSDDILWCKENLMFHDKNVTFIEGNTDYNDLWLMSMCRENIIANSTFSWWGAWLNNNKNKKVFAPKIWFGSHSNHNTDDLIPTEWKKI
jgi:hypothetical protein